MLRVCVCQPPKSCTCHVFVFEHFVLPAAAGMEYTRDHTREVQTACVGALRREGQESGEKSKRAHGRDTDNSRPHGISERTLRKRMRLVVREAFTALHG